MSGNVVEKSVIEKAKVRSGALRLSQESVQGNVKNPPAVVIRESEETEEGRRLRRQMMSMLIVDRI